MNVIEENLKYTSKATFQCFLKCFSVVFDVIYMFAGLLKYLQQISHQICKLLKIQIEYLTEEKLYL